MHLRTVAICLSFPLWCFWLHRTQLLSYSSHCSEVSSAQVSRVSTFWVLQMFDSLHVWRFCNKLKGSLLFFVRPCLSQRWKFEKVTLLSQESTLHLLTNTATESCFLCRTSSGPLSIDLFCPDCSALEQAHTGARKSQRLHISHTYHRTAINRSCWRQQSWVNELQGKKPSVRIWGWVKINPAPLPEESATTEWGRLR